MRISQAGDGLRDVRKGGLLFGRQDYVKCQVGVKIAGQISVLRATICRGISGQIRTDRSELLMPAKVCGPGNRMPGQSNWVSFVEAMAAHSERGLS
jgi:hypothetical protein